MDLKDVTVGMRVAIHPATNLWMRGVRFATVVKVGRKLVTVEDDNERHWVVAPRNLEAT